MSRDRWRALIVDNDEAHVVPIDDYREHYAEKGCWCHPEYKGDGTWTHNSLDRREEYEPDADHPRKPH